MTHSKSFHSRKGTALRIHPLVRILIGVVLLFLAVIVIRTIVTKSSHTIPPVTGGSSAGFFASKRALAQRISDLEAIVASYDAQITELGVLRDENETLKNEFGRGFEADGILAHPRTLPNRSIYDTFVIDAGEINGVSVGDTVYAFNMIAIGTITRLEGQSAVVELFSAPGKETTGTAEGTDVTVTLVGRGGGEYEVRLPRDIPFDIGSIITDESVYSHTLARVERVITDPRDPFQRVLAKVPVNLQALKWVVVR